MLVCWNKDGSAKLVRPLTPGDVVLIELGCCAEMLAEAAAALNTQADNIEWRDEGAANNLRRVAMHCKAQERDARTAIERTAE